MDRESSSLPIVSLPRAPAPQIAPTAVSLVSATVGTILCIAVWLGLASALFGRGPERFAPAPEVRDPAAAEVLLPAPSAEAGGVEVPLADEATDRPAAPALPLAVRKAGFSGHSAGSEPKPTRRSAPADGAATLAKADDPPALTIEVGSAPRPEPELGRHLRANGLADAGGARA